ncbi:Vgb family protein [Diaminobutyricibacter sp. McL0608]|uniref:Vgb family protein n=1 Tax=Leifsonia sp. McL0608 TaxID=3143537 RepID=UPI0031F2E3AE
MTRIVEHPVTDASAGPYGITVTDDGAVWFTLVHAGRVGRRDANGTLAFVDLGDTAQPSLVSRATEESVWVTDTTGNRVVHVGRAPVEADDAGDAIHILNEVAVPTMEASPFGITTLYDGTVWFTELAADALGRIDIMGRVTEFPVGRADAMASMIAGSGDSVWFTLNQGNAVGHVRGGDAAIQYFELPRPVSGPVGIAVAEDGAVWFAEVLGGALGRISRNGVLSEIALPDPDSKPHAITASPTGGCWFTLWGSNQVGFVTDQGDLTLHDLPTPASEPHGIAVAPDGHVWVALERGMLAELA